MTTIKLGISSCLIGERVRWNGEHKIDRFLTDTLGVFAQYLPVCPEIECGFGVPREPFRLMGDPQAPRLVTTRTKQDYTECMLQWACTRVRELEKEGLWGFIFKSNSPSSGMARVKVYNNEGVPIPKGVGIFARAFMEHFSLLPVEDEGRLHDTELRENFIERIFTMKRWREAVARRQSRGNLLSFHEGHELLILSHSPRHCRTMKELVSQDEDVPLEGLYERYQGLLMEVLRLRATPKKHSNVLQRIMGYLGRQLCPRERQELQKTIDDYCKGYVPLIVPMTLVNHYARLHDQAYLRQQYYLTPHPLELQLRNHV